MKKVCLYFVSSLLAFCLYFVIVPHESASLMSLKVPEQGWILLNTPEYDCKCLNKEAVAQRCSLKKVFVEILQNSQENTCARVSFFIMLRPEVCNFIKNETLVQVFSCEFCKISKNTPCYREPLVAASVNKMFWLCWGSQCVSSS